MPQSDTWPGGARLETMNGMDSAGSCDSVLSANSGSSDDSLEYLSAEEKACLMFLEETIESLDTEEDSGLSNDEPDQLPSPGSLATKLADLSASMSKSKLNGSQEPALKETTKDNLNSKLIYSYLVPTPFVVANSARSFVPSAKTLLSKLPITSNNYKPDHKPNQTPAAPPVPIEVHFEIPLATKPRDPSGKTVEFNLPRGPLSYEALVHLRRSASAKKTPLCPTVDHTIESDKHLPSPVQGLNLGNPHRSGKSHKDFSKCKTGPPAVPPKPKVTPANISLKTQNGPLPSDCSISIKKAKDPQVVRLEALQKLGLLREEESDTVAPLPPQKLPPSLDQTANRFTKGPSNCNASRSPSFCYSQVPTEPKNRSLQSSASFHNYSRRDQQPVSSPPSNPLQSNGLRKTGMERSASLDDQRSYGTRPEPQQITPPKPSKTTCTVQSAAQKPPNSKPVPEKPSNLVGYTVMVVPGMGADRKEALRKLGLLKDH